MTEDQFQQMIADREAGTKGNWYVFEPEDYEGPGTLPSLGVEADGGEAVVWYATDAEEGIANDFDARRIARVPELEEEVIRLRADVVKLRLTLAAVLEMHEADQNTPMHAAARNMLQATYSESLGEDQ